MGHEDFTDNHARGHSTKLDKVLGMITTRPCYTSKLVTCCSSHEPTLKNWRHERTHPRWKPTVSRVSQFGKWQTKQPCACLSSLEDWEPEPQVTQGTQWLHEPAHSLQLPQRWPPTLSRTTGSTPGLLRANTRTSTQTPPTTKKNPSLTRFASAHTTAGRPGTEHV